MRKNLLQGLGKKGVKVYMKFVAKVHRYEKELKVTINKDLKIS